MKTKKLFVKIAAVIMAGVFLSTQVYPALAANYSFIQTDWFGGQSTATATHSANKTGWNKYALSDNNVYTNSPGTTSVSPVSSALYGNPQFPYAPKPVIDHTYSDFTKSTVTTVRNVNVINNAPEGTLRLDSTINNPFYSTLGHWTTLPANPHVPYQGQNGYFNSAFTTVKDNPNPGDYYVYSLWSGSSGDTTFARWNVNTQKWEFLGNFEVMEGDTLRQISIGGGYDTGTSLAYPDSGDYIYALRGSGTKEFYRYSVSTGQWARLKDFPENVLAGGAIVATNNNPLVIWGIGGGGRSNLYRYDGNNWSLVTNLGFNIFIGGGMVYPGGNSVYVFSGNSSQNCGKFNKSGGTYSSVTQTPYQFTFATSMSYPGEGDYIYFVNKPFNTWQPTGEFMRLNFKNDTWEYSPRKSGLPQNTLSRIPFPSILGKGHFYYKDNKICYLKPDVRLTRPFTYDLAANKWDEPSSGISISSSVYKTNPDGSAFTWDGADNIYYVINLYGAFFKYSMSDNQWEATPSPYLLQSNTSGSGCEFLPLYIPGQSGSGPQYPFNSPNAGLSVAYYNGYIYLMAGTYSSISKQAFARYNTTIKNWQAIATPPRGVNSGGFITAGRDPVNGKDYIYAFRGNNSSEFWRYEIPAADTEIGHWELFNINNPSEPWTTNISTAVTGLPNSPWTGAPLTAWTGGCLIYPGAGDYLYATFRGDYVGSPQSNYQRWFYRFSLINNAWERLNDIPAEAALYGISANSLLVYSPYDQSIYFVSSSVNSAMVKYPLGNVTNPNPTTTAWQIVKTPDGHFVKKPFIGIPACTYVHDSTTNSDYLYAFSGNSDGLYRYNLMTGKWDPPQREYAGADYGQAILGPDKDTVYFITGYPGYRVLIWKYSISKQKWLDYIPADPQFMPWVGTLACYPGLDAAGNTSYIYILEGGYGPRLWRLNTGWDPNTNTYDKTKEAFERLEDCVPGGQAAYFYNGANLTGDGNNLYVIKGGNLDFYKYKIYAPQGDLEPSGWYKLPDLPSNPGSDPNDQTFIHTTGGVNYWINTNNKYVYKYDGVSWSDSGFPAMSSNIGSGTALGCAANIDGTDYLFLVTLYGSFYKCSKGASSWQELAAFPMLATGQWTYGATLFYKGSGDYLYAVPGGSYTYLMRYSISKNVWDKPVAMPWEYATNMSMADLGDGDNIYYRSGYYGGFYKYSASNNSWTSAIGSPDSNLAESARMTGTGDAIYATTGYNTKNFRKCDTASWASMKDLPDPLGSGSDICFKNNYIYALKGGNTNIVWRYDFSNTWTTVNSSGLGGVGAGGRLCAGDEDHIYCVRGAGTSDFYRYHPDSGTWEGLEPIPSAIGYNSYGNSAVCYPGFGDNIYVMPSSNWGTYEGASKLLYKYSISETDPAKKWKEMSPPPMPVTYGCDLVYPGSGNYIYATAGYGANRTFQRYLAFLEGEYVSDIKYIWNNTGFDTASWSGNGKGNIEVRIRTSESPDMTGAPKWGDCPKLASGSLIGQGRVSSVTDGHKYVQYQVKMTADDINAIPELYNIRIDYKIYPNKQELISSPYNTEFKNNRIMNLSWTKSTPPGTDIRLQLQTSPDGANWSEWYGPGPGDTQDFIDVYSAANANKFSYQQPNGPAVIEIIDDGANTGARLKKLYSDFAHTQEIVFDNTLGPSGQNITLFVEIPSSNVDFWDNIKDPAGADVRFASSDGSLLPYNLSTFGGTFDSVNRYAKILVRIQSVPANAKFSIFLKYGKTGAVSLSDPTIIGVPTNGLVGYWTFNEGSGNNVADWSGNSNTGTLINGPSWVAGKSGSALSFDGSNRYVDLGGGASLKIGLPMTLSMWIKLPTNPDGNWRHLFSNTSWGGNPGYDTMIQSNQQLIMTVNGAETTSPRPNFDITTGPWHHIVYAVDPTTSKLYIDGSLRQTWFGSWNTSKVVNNTCLGNTPVANNYSPFFGSMDEVAIYNRALSGPEIQTLYNGTGMSMTPPYYFYTISENNTCGALGPDWGKRLAVSVDNRSGGDLYNYQVLVNLDASQEDFWNSSRSDGYDIRFVDFDGNPSGAILQYWRPSGGFNYMNKNASLWVNIPVIPANQVKTFYLYYGYTGTGMPPDRSAFGGAMTKAYFNPAPADPASRDFPEAAPNDSGIRLDGTNYISVGHSNTLIPTGGLTVEAQVNLDISNGGWYPGFASRKQLTFTNSTGYSINNGAVKFDVAYESAMKADYSDLRFIDSGGNKLKYYIISYDGSKASVYLNLSLATGAAATVYMYYGNAGASSESDAGLANGLPITLFSRLYTNSSGSSPLGPDNNNYTVNNVYLPGQVLIFASVANGTTWYGYYGTPQNPRGYIYYNDMEISQGGTVLWHAAEDPLLETGNLRQLYQNFKTFTPGYYTVNWHSNANVQQGKDKTSLGLGNYLGKYGAEICVTYFSITPVVAPAEQQESALDQRVIFKDGFYQLRFTKDGLTAAINSASLSTVSYDVGKFMNVAVTYDKSYIRLLINGVEKAKTPLSSVTPDANNLIIGQSMKGVVDEIRIWNKARPPAEIYADKERNIKGSADELTAMGMAMDLKCNENSGNICYDSTSNGNNGQLSALSWQTRPFSYINEKPVALYHFDKYGGNPFNDSSGNGNNTSAQYQVNSNASDLMSAAVYPDIFIPGYSVNFKTGQSAYMQVNDSPSLGITKGLTIECWVKPQDASIVNKQVILAKGDDSANPKKCNYMLYCASNEIGLSYIDNTGAERTYQTTGANLQSNLPAHVAAIVDESSRTVNIYINGVNKYSGSMYSGNLVANNASLYIGKSAASVLSPSGNQTTYYTGDLDELRIYNRVLPFKEILAHYGYYTYALTVPINFYYFDPTVLDPALGAYPTNNPVIQPVIGVFYNTTNKIVKYGFTDSTIMPAGTAIKYQISNDGYNWYWFGTDANDLVDGTTVKWRKAYGAYTSGQVNTSQEIGNNIDLFQTGIAPEGEFYYRAYLHTENMVFNTPILKSVNITLNTGVQTFYTDSSGAGNININHTDAVGDQYFRYKAILYSSGQAAPQLNDVTIEYVNASLNISSPFSTTYGLGQNLPIIYYAEAVPSGKATIKYNTYNSDGSLSYSRTILTGAAAGNGTHTINWPVDTSDKNLVAPRCKIELISEDSYNAVDSLSSMFTTAALQVTAPVSSNIWEIGTSANLRPHTIMWNNFGLASTNGDSLTIQYSLNGGSNWAASDNIATGLAPEELSHSYEWDNTWSGRNASLTDNAVIRIFKPAVSQDPGTPGNLIGVSAPFALVPIPKITVLSFAKLEYKAGTPLTIAWQTNQSQFSSKVDIDYSTDGFQTTHPITPAGGTSIGTSAGKPNSPITGSYLWTPQQEDMFNNIIIRVKEQGYPSSRDTKQSMEGVSAQSISVVPPTITISSPVAGYRWVLGDTQTVTWTTDGAVSSTLLFEYSKDGAMWYPLLAGASTIPNNTAQINNSYSWTIQEPPSGPGLTGGKAQIRLTDVNKNTIIGISPQFEVLGTATIAIVQPNGGENIILGTLYTIKWSTWGNILAPGGTDYYKIDIYYKIKEGDDADIANWLRIANQIPNTGELQWLVDSAIYSETDKGKIKILDHNNPSIYSISASTFNITHPEVGFDDSPSGGDTWFAGGLYDLKWNTKGTVGSLAIEYFVNGVSASWSPVTFQSGITETSNPYDPIRHFYGKWRVPNYPGKQVQIRLTDTTRPVVTATVTISLQKPTINILSPTTANATGANSWALGTDHSIRWTTLGGLAGALNGFKILFSKTGAFDAASPVLATISDPALINTDTERSIPFSWNALTSQGIDPVSTTARIKIVDVNDAAISQVSDPVTISAPSINITAPVFVSDVYMGQQYLITWYIIGNIQTAYPLTILYDRNVNDSALPVEITPPNFMSDNPAIQDLGNGARGYLWTVPSRQADYPDYTPGSSQIRIEGNYPSLQAAASDQFAIKYPQITIINPGNIISATDTVNVAWTTNSKGALTGPFLVEWATKNDFSNAKTIYPDPNNPLEPYWPSGTSQIQWLVPLEAVSANVWLRVRDIEWLSGQVYKVEGYSPNSFAVLPEPDVTITSPNVNTSGPDNAWRLGNIVTISWIKNNSGAMSNNLEGLSFYYTLNALSGTSPENWTWVPFTPTDYEYNEITGARSVKWAIPVTLNPSVNSAIKIYDNVPWRNLPEKHLSIVSDRFEIAIPRIVITSPKTGECWAYQDKPTITWYSDGAIDDNSLAIYFTATADTSPSYNMISPTLKEPNSGTFTWSGGIPIGTRTSTPSNPNGQIRINATYGGNKLVMATSDKVTIIAQPAITITEPGGSPSQEYEIGKDMTIKWSSQGISVNSVKIEYSSDGFSSPANIKTIENSVSNIPNAGGEYKWTIPNNALVGRNIEVRISKVGDSGIQGISPNVFRIKGGFDITSPNGAESWVAKSPQTITWSPRGSISKVKLELSWDSGQTWEAPFATDVDNTGSYSWTLPDIPAGQQIKVMDKARIRISNQADDTEFDTSNADFSILYATIIFYVVDYDGGQQMQDIIVQKENGTDWTGSALVSPIKREYVYPYGTYATFFTKTDYIDNSVTWAAPKQQKTGDAWIITVTLENKALAQVTFESILTYSYTPSTDILNAAGSLQRKGKIVGTTEDDRNKLGNETLTIYEPASQTVKYRLTASPPADRTNWNGMYYFTINPPTGFVGGQVYPATLTTEYGSETINDITTPRVYTSTANIEIGLQSQAEELSKKIDESTAQLTTALDNSTGQIMVALGTTGTSITKQIETTQQKITDTQQQISETKQEISTAITTAKDELKAETDKIRVATETTLPTQIKEKVETVLRSEILNRETVVRIGTKLTVRYRIPANANAKPVVDIYDPNNNKVLLQQNVMTKSQDIAANAMLPGMAVYQLDVQTGRGWIPGDYTIICSDPASGTMDAMMISMLRTDLEDIAGQIGTVLGTTANLSDMKEVADTLNSQFSIIESALGKISTDMVNKVKEVAASAGDVESVYSQLVNIGKELKNLGATQDVNLGKLLEVSKEKRQDIRYLKNKTQELKAVMELSQKMIDNIAHKPVTQTWFEYK